MTRRFPQSARPELVIFQQRWEVRATVLFLSSARRERHRAVLYLPPRRSHDDSGQLLSVHTVHLSQSCPSPPGWEWLTELPSSWLFQSLPALTAGCIIVITRPRPILPSVIHFRPKMRPGSDMCREWHALTKNTSQLMVEYVKVLRNMIKMTKKRSYLGLLCWQLWADDEIGGKNRRNIVVAKNRFVQPHELIIGGN